MKKVAIYSRKSKFTGKGDSIENQIEMCKEYITRNFGKDVEYIIYEDEGFSGSTLNRPKFLKLMQDIKSKKINVLACYRLDRISRNVADFSSTLEILNSFNVDFISISEQFDTSNPMGKAMIYISSVFAQLERETIAERVKDNMLEIAKNGKWTGGRIPLGFISKKIKYADEMGLQREITTLIINEPEMKFVKFLYGKYLELGSLHKLECYITENNLKSRNNILFEKSTLKIILQNPVYVKANDLIIEYLKTTDWIVYGDADNIHSLLTYNKSQQSMVNGKYVKTLKNKGERLASVSNIKGAIEPDLWLQVQNQFEANKDKFPRLGKTNNALLTGKLKCGVCNEYMLVQHGRISKITGNKLFYYMCSLKRKSHKKCCNNSNANAADLESLVLFSLKKLSTTKQVFIDELKLKYNSVLKDTERVDEKVALNKLLLEKKKQISGLITELSKENDEYMRDLIRIEINPLKNECIKIEGKLLAADNQVKKEKVDKINLHLIESVLNECGIIDTLPRERQKQIIDVLIEKIYWYHNDENKAKIVIKFIGTDGEDNEELEFDESMLQFSSPSITCIE
ncbi:recombinase family protein [Clostridium estertheticum]|uniref:recombinase family protein n=1 Tax=Clostridium estertheticum TaxID=238834 RepID=UPI001C0D3D43|nr:recombinase family protein [Clostridium estertheticum]MBU3176307.1 recombinase family protein [Clostridium estertheticum]